MWTGDVFVTASKSENMPVSVLEGMSTGLPVIAVSEKGLPEIVEDNKNGILVNADDPIAFARAICGLIHNPSLRKVMTENSRARALLYSSTRIGEKLEMLYKTLLLQS
jgi:glycosyltransferase involved in cell wall biosynthesis